MAKRNYFKKAGGRQEKMEKVGQTKIEKYGQKERWKRPLEIVSFAFVIVSLLVILRCLLTQSLFYDHKTSFLLLKLYKHKSI